MLFFDCLQNKNAMSFFVILYLVTILFKNINYMTEYLICSIKPYHIIFIY